MGLIVNKKELAEIIGVTERSLTEWQKHDSFPIEVLGNRGQSNRYDTVKVIQFMIDRALAGKSKETNRERIERIQANRMELDYFKEAGLFFEDDEREMLDAIMGIKNTILSGDSTLKMQLDSLYGIDIDVEVLNEHSRSLLGQLAALAQKYEEDDSEVSEGI